MPIRFGVGSYRRYRTVRVVWGGLVGVGYLWLEGGEVVAVRGIICNIGLGKQLTK